MDPEVTLGDIRDNLVLWYEEGSEGALEEVASATEHLIEWLDNGGYLPKCWQR